MADTAPRPLLLAVEDELPIVELLSTLVAPLGLELRAASTAREAIQILDESRPALVTLDLVLPDLDGFAVLEHIRARRDLEDLPVIVLTALADGPITKRAYALGAADFIVKPFNVDLLEAKLRVFLRLRALADEVRAREHFLIDVVEHLSSGLAVCDDKGRLVRLNAAGALQLGLTDAALALGRPLGEVAPGAEALLTLDSQLVQRRATIRTPRGERQLGFTTGPLDRGGVVIVFRELSAAETARRDAETRHRLETLARASRRFAHEVRNPLAAISAAAQMLGRDDVDLPLRRRLAQAIDGEAQRIAGLVHEHVDFRAPAPPTGRTDLSALLSEVVEINLLGVPARARVSVDCAPSLPSIHADAARIKQVVLNLVFNAIAATEQGGAIALVACGEREGVTLRVRDTGCGIAQDDLPRIFDESFSTRVGGEGLGLPIARRIVEEHGGSIHVESKPGEGTTFTVWLRAAGSVTPELG